MKGDDEYRLRLPFVLRLDDEVRHMMEYAELTREQAWAKIASYALAKQSEAAVEQARKG